MLRKKLKVYRETQKNRVFNAHQIAIAVELFPWWIAALAIITCKAALLLSDTPGAIFNSSLSSNLSENFSKFFRFATYFRYDLLALLLIVPLTLRLLFLAFGIKKRIYLITSVAMLASSAVFIQAGTFQIS